MKNNKVNASKNRKMLIVILIAVLFAALAGIGVYKILTPQRTTVYIFNADYSAGTQVTGKMLTPVEVDSNLVVNSQSAAARDYIITKENYRDILSSAGTLRNDVHSGNFFTSAMLSTTGGNRIEMVMQSDAIAVTIAANNVTGITQGLQYGSRVNVYANYEGSTTLLLEGIRVLNVAKDNTGSISAITLEVNVTDSMRLVHASSYGTIHLGLINMTGYQATGENGLTYNITGFNKQTEGEQSE